MWQPPAPVGIWIDSPKYDEHCEKLTGILIPHSKKYPARIQLKKRESTKTFDGGEHFVLENLGVSSEREVGLPSPSGKRKENFRAEPSTHEYRAGDCRRRRSRGSTRASPSSDNSKSSVVVLYRSRRKPSWSDSSGRSYSATPKSCVWTGSAAKVGRSVLLESPRSKTTRKSPNRSRKSRRFPKSFKIRRNEQTRSDSQVASYDQEAEQNQSRIGDAAECLREGRENRGEQSRRYEEAALPRTRSRRSRRRYRDGGEDENDDEPCRGNFDRAAGDSKSMAQHPNPESARGHHARTESFEPDLGALAQNFNERHPKGMGDNNLAPLSTSELQRVFPFQATPSGNLKIVPNQVVFESKKVSVLVAEPRHAKVNVKAEQVGRLSHAIGAPNAPGTQANNCIAGNSNKQQPLRQPMTIDLPPGVTTSTVDRLQAQRKLPSVHHQPELAAGELGARPRTQPFNRARTSSQQMGQQLQQTAEDGQAGGGARREPIIDDVPLSSLGFTTEQPIDWNNVTLPEKTDLYRELSRRITQYKNADCIVRIDNDEFHCHLLVLQSYSAFFDDRNVKQMDLTGSTVTSRAFSIIYDWMISPTSESCQLLRRDNILEIFLAAQYLGIKELEEQCWAFIDNDELFSEDTAFLLYLEARKIGNTAVMELMVPRIMKFFLMLVSTRDFLELSVEELCLLLRSNYICVNSEMEILMSAVRWLMYDWESRKQYMIDVMKCVRFGLIAPWQLVDVKRNPENPEFMELMSYPEIQKMVDDGLAFVIIKYWYGNQTEDYYHWIDLLGLSEPTNRNWAGEDKHYVTYREFLLYLEEYQRTKVLDFKNKKPHRPSPPQSPPKDESSPQTTPPLRPRMNHQSAKIADVSPGGANMRLPMQHGNPSSNNKHMPPCMMMPPEMLSQYLSDMTNGVSQGRETNTLHVKRLSGGAEQPLEIHKASSKHKKEKKKQSHVRISEESSHNPRSYLLEAQPSLSSTLEHSTRKLQSIKCLYRRNGSLKSEDEAATAIQAMYRGYKTRKRLREHISERNLKFIAVELSSSNEHPSKVQERSKNLAASSKGEQIGKTESFQSFTHYQVEEAVSDEESTDLSIKTIMPPAFVDTNDDVTITSSREIPHDDNLSLPAENEQAASQLAQLSDHLGTEIKKLGPSTTASQSTKKLTKHKPSKIPHCELLAMVGMNRADARMTQSYQKSQSRGEVILVFGGIDPHTKYGRKGSSGKDVYCYRPDENRWTFVGEMPEPRHHHSVAYLTGRVYLAEL